MIIQDVGHLRLRRLRLIARWGIWGCFAFLQLLCGLVLLGWFLDVPLWVSWGSLLPTMKVLTAAGFLTTGLSMLCSAASRWTDLRPYRRGLEVGSTLLAFAPLFLGFFVFGHYLMRTVGVREMQETAPAWTSLPTPVTAASLVLFGLTLLTARCHKMFRFFQGCLTAAVVLAWFSLVCVTYGEHPYDHVPFFGAVSLPAALGMMVICTGLFFLRPQEGLVRIITASSYSGQLVRQVLPLVVVLTFSFGLLRLWAEHRWGFPTALGTAFYSTLMMMILAGVIMRNALTTDRLGRMKQRSERRMIKSLRETQNALIQAQAFLESAPGGMVVTDAHGKILQVNSLIHSLFGYPEGEVVQQALEGLVPGLGLALEEEGQGMFFENSKGFGSVGPFELLARRHDGSLFAVEVSLSPLETQEGTRMIGSIRDIRKRRTVEKALQASESKFRGIFNNTFQFMGLLTPEGRLLEANQTALELIQVEALAVRGKYFWECPWWNHSASVQQRLRESTQQAVEGEVVRFQTWCATGDDMMRQVDFSLKPVVNEGKEVVYLVPEWRDITDMVEDQNQQLAKERLYKQEIELNQQRLQLATEAAGIGIWDWDVVANELIWDDQMHSIYQVPSMGPRLDYEVWESRLHADDRAEVVRAFRQASNGQEGLAITFRIRWPDDSIHYVQAKGLVLRDEAGKSVRMLGTNTDITKQVMAEAGLLESEERFRHAFEYSPVGLALLDPEGVWMAVNKAVCDIVGYTEDELLKKTFQDITHPDDLEKDLDNVNRLIGGEITHYQMEKRYLHREGHIVWVLLTASLVKEEDGSPAYFISHIEDITQRHEADLVLKHQREQLSLLIEHTPAAVAMFDMEMRYVAASRRWQEDYHLQSQRLQGRCHYEIFPEIGHEWKEIHRQCLAGAVESREEDMFVRSDGQEEWLRWEVRPWLEVGGEIGGIVMFTEVITERKRAAEKIQASLEEKEVLLREIHHRVKNNMQIISSLLQLQTSSLHDPADVAIFQDCQTRIHAMAMVHDRLYRSGNLSTINFGEHLRELADLLMRGQAGGMRPIQIHTQFDEVELDLDKAIPLGLIATELITNAFKHAFKGREGGNVSLLLQRCGQNQMTLRVSDDGHGLPIGADPVSARTLGLRLVRSLSHQLRAQIMFTPIPVGCCVEITFNV